MDVDVSVERLADGSFNAKLSAEPWEVNVRASAMQLGRLRGIREVDWNRGRSIAVGESAGAPVFWSCKGDEATLMIGHDDETWDVAVNFPVRVVDEIVRAATRE